MKYDLDRIHRIPCENILFAARPAHSREVTRRGMYHSPWHEDRIPSLHIDAARNQWYDHSMGDEYSGDGITLAALLNGLDPKADFQKVCQWICDNVDPSAKIDLIYTEDISSGSPSSGITTTVKNAHEGFFSADLINYAVVKRGIPTELLNRYCRQVEYEITGTREGKDGKSRQWRIRKAAIGFANVDGDWALRLPDPAKDDKDYERKNRYKKTSTGQNISIILADGTMIDSPEKKPRTTTDTAIVFEGFMNFLSYLTMRVQRTPLYDTVVINAAGNDKKAVDYLGGHRKVVYYSDNDERGRKSSEYLRNALAERYPGTQFFDASHIYSGYDDLNECHMASVDEKRRQLREQKDEKRRQAETAKEQPPSAAHKQRHH